MNSHRIEIKYSEDDTRAKSRLKNLQSMGYKITELKITDVYSTNGSFKKNDLEKIANAISNPIIQTNSINSPINGKDKFDWVIEVGYLPGVTDNTGHTAKETAEDLLKLKFKNNESIFSSQMTLITGKLSKNEVMEISNSLYNPLIQRAIIKSEKEFKHDNGMKTDIPVVHLSGTAKTNEVNLNIPDDALTLIGKEGIQNPDGTRNGPLSLDLKLMKVIRDYFNEIEKRNPTDIELESLAQTWSEHCKHNIFAAQIDEIKDGLYKHYIKRATEEIRKQMKEGKHLYSIKDTANQNKRDKKLPHHSASDSALFRENKTQENKDSNNDFCVSVFSDNSGGIIFDENYLVTDKCETHNSPSALDPYGGAMTGIVGVNRDCLGFGKGAKPILNRYGFCLGLPNDDEAIFKDKERKQKMLSPKRIMQGVIEGVGAGGNCSGIPTPQGFLYFNYEYKGKPLVFAGTVGLIPRLISKKKSHEKKAQPGDKIVMIGGRVGQDGIHGATFSSESLNTGSPATAVQIGDPYTQKKFSDAIIREARDSNMYNSITDNGAGGLSCSVAEMAKESGGCEVELEKVPLKYPNLEPWEIWISESQERMTLAVPPKKLKEFLRLMKKREVEATVIGTFTNSGRCIVKYDKKTIMNMDMNFLHNGIPQMILKSKPYSANTHLLENKMDFGSCFECAPPAKGMGVGSGKQLPKSTAKNNTSLNETLLSLISSPNHASTEFVSTQYDHNVLGGIIIGPLQGKGRVNGTATVCRPLLNSSKGIITSQSLYPQYSDIDAYHMAACSIDTVIRQTLAAGGSLKEIALMDNFCWCSSNEPERLYQLKEAARACYDYAVAYGTPYISGKDSMFNDFNGFDENGKPIKISAPPTLLISSLGVIDNIEKCVTIDPKIPGDLVYIMGETKNECPYSTLTEGEIPHESPPMAEPRLVGEIPAVDAQTSLKTYLAFEQLIQNDLISSAFALAHGGLATALMKTCIAGQLGMTIDLTKIQTTNDSRLPTPDSQLLFSESQSRFLITIDPKNKSVFEKIMQGTTFAEIGTVTEDPTLKIISLNKNPIISLSIDKLTTAYRSTFKNN